MGLVLRIITPTGVTLETEVKSVVLPSSEGEIEILPGHMSLITIINAGELVAKGDRKKEIFAIDAGFVKVSGDVVSVLTDESLSMDAADINEIEEATARARQALEDARNRRDALDPSEIEMLEAKVKYQMAKKLIKVKR